MFVAAQRAQKLALDAEALKDLVNAENYAMDCSAAVKKGIPAGQDVAAIVSRRRDQRDAALRALVEAIAKAEGHFGIRSR